MSEEHKDRVAKLKSEGFTEDDLCDRLNRRNAHEGFRIMKSPKGIYFKVSSHFHETIHGYLGETLIKYTTFNEGVPTGTQVQEG